MIHKKSEKGQAIILIVFAIIGLVGMTGLTVDGGRVYSDRRQAQSAADTAAYAAGLAKIRDTNIVTAGQQRAADNGYTNDGTRSVVIVENPPLSGDYTCAAIPDTCNDYIQVTITSNIPLTFSRLLGKAQLTNTVHAVARATPGVTDTFFDGAALVSLKTTGNATFNVNGNFTLDVNDSGVFVNSSSNCAFNANGNGSTSVDTAYSVVGTACKNGNVTMNGPVQSASQVPYPPSIDIPLPSITCSGNGSVTGNTVNPGNFPSSLSLNGNGNYTFSPGNYCINNGSVSINGNINVAANDVNFRIDNGTFSINGNSKVVCDNMLIHVVSGSGISFNGNGSNNCSNVTFIAEDGTVSWNGNVANTFTAPTSGSYKGLVLYMPLSNNETLVINGNSGNHITGSMIAPAATVTINGNSGTTGLHTQIIGYTININGNSNTIINFDAEEQYQTSQPPTVELTQ